VCVRLSSCARACATSAIAARTVIEILRQLQRLGIVRHGLVEEYCWASSETQREVVGRQLGMDGQISAWLGRRRSLVGSPLPTHGVAHFGPTHRIRGEIRFQV